MNEIKIFNNIEFGEIRTVKINNEPWFVGKDIADALGYEEPHKAVSRHVDNDDRMKCPLIDSIGRKQETIIINESGLYSLILSSKLPKAKKFKRWVTSEVLPDIRKFGIYTAKDTLEKILVDPDFGIEILTQYKEEKEKRLFAERKAETLSVQLDESKRWYTIKRVAHLNCLNWKGFNWKLLKEQSNNMGFKVDKIFDANFGTVNSYHEDVWKAVYPHLVY